MAQGPSTPFPLRPGRSADAAPAGAAAHRPPRRAVTRQLTGASSEPTTGRSVDLAPVGLVGDAVVRVAAACGEPPGLAGDTERGAA